MREGPRFFYFARFLMIIANHLIKNLAIAQPDNKLECWVQSKRVCCDLLRILVNQQVPLKLPLLMQVQSSNPIRSSNRQTSSVVCAAMEVEHPEFPNQAVKPKKIAKPKTKKSTSGVSQKAPVVKSTTLQPEGNVKEISGEGRGDHQRSPRIRW